MKTFCFHGVDKNDTCYWCLAKARTLLGINKMPDKPSRWIRTGRFAKQLFEDILHPFKEVQLTEEQAAVTEQRFRDLLQDVKDGRV